MNRRISADRSLSRRQWSADSVSVVPLWVVASFTVFWDLRSPTLHDEAPTLLSAGPVTQSESDCSIFSFLTVPRFGVRQSADQQSSRHYRSQRDLRRDLHTVRVFGGFFTAALARWTLPVAHVCICEWRVKTNKKGETRVSPFRMMPSDTPTNFRDASICSIQTVGCPDRFGS